MKAKYDPFEDKSLQQITTKILGEAAEAQVTTYNVERGTITISKFIDGSGYTVSIINKKKKTHVAFGLSEEAFQALVAGYFALYTKPVG